MKYDSFRGVDPALDASPLRWKDLLWAALFALGVLALLVRFSYPGIYPPVWEDLSIALGQRPPDALFPGVWRSLVRALSHNLDYAHLAAWLRHLGHASGCFIAFVTYLLFNEALMPVLRRRLRIVLWRDWQVRGIVATASALFVCYSAVWSAGQCFTPTTLLLLELLPATWIVLRFLRMGRLWSLAPAFILFGLAAGDSIAGFFFALGAILLCLARGRYPRKFSDWGIQNPFGSAVLRTIAARRLTMMFALGLLVSVATDVRFYLNSHGPEANGVNGSALVPVYISHYFNTLFRGADFIGWFFGLMLVVVPFGFTGGLAWHLGRRRIRLPFVWGVPLIVIGVLALTQVCGFAPCWFSSWTDPVPSVRSDIARIMLAFLSAATWLWAFTLIGADWTSRGARGKKTATLPRRLLDFALRSAAPIALLVAVPFVPQGTLRKMISIVGEYAHEVVSECGEVRFVFTDGHLDAGIEVAAWGLKQNLHPLSMMAGRSPRETYIRTLGALDDEDRTVLTSSATDALRTWVCDKEMRLKDFAVQLGFEIWKRDGKDMPRTLGVVARPQGVSDASVERGRKVAQFLAQRVFELCRDFSPATVADYHLRSAFRYVQWRLSRMCRQRALVEKADAAGVAEDLRLAEALDEYNDSLQALRRRLDWMSQQGGSGLMPREGLRIALARSDFSLAIKYADSILANDPDDTAANFAMGMNHFLHEQYGRAEVFLKRCLIRRPDEPAVLNNLAIIALRNARFDEAEEYARRALKNAPQANPIASTLKRILEAKGNNPVGPVAQ